MTVTRGELAQMSDRRGTAYHLVGRALPPSARATRIVGLRKRYGSCLVEGMHFTTHVRHVALLTATLALAAACGDDDGGSTSGGGNTNVGPGGNAGGDATGGNAAGGDATGGMGGAGGDTGPGGGGGSSVAFTFFVTSTGNGANGGNLGGLAGADAKCQSHADAAGLGAATWRAYLSTAAEDARDRIGTGRWTNFDGEVVAADVTSLHANGLSNGMPQHMLDELGNTVPQAEHDILTGSDEDGTLFPNATCADWTSNGDGPSARVGHSDIPPAQFSPSWNSAHTVGSCTEGGLASTLGAARLYCFAL
jgi:hypothetical protein